MSVSSWLISVRARQSLLHKFLILSLLSTGHTLVVLMCPFSPMVQPITSTFMLMNKNGVHKLQHYPPISRFKKAWFIEWKYLSYPYFSLCRFEILSQQYIQYEHIFEVNLHFTNARTQRQNVTSWLGFPFVSSDSCFQLKIIEPHLGKKISVRTIL